MRTVAHRRAGLADTVLSVVRAHSEGKVLGDVDFFQQVKVDIKDGRRFVDTNGLIGK